ncbi:hypothetical protein BAC3_00727 [uncultured bacterium]|nr:hypothetical protein BAC3_00727 [uncultured bacterium]
MSNQKKQPGKKTPSYLPFLAGAFAIAGIVLYYFLSQSPDPPNPVPARPDMKQDLYTYQKEGVLSFHRTAEKNSSYKEIDIEISDDNLEREVGLMFRTQMDPNTGMYFIFPYEDRQSFWMRNTRISLDILFINKDGKIVTIHKSTQINSDTSYPSTEPSQYVLEVVAGFTDTHGVAVGDYITYKRL